MSDYLSAAYYYTKWKFQEFLDERGTLFKSWPLMESSLTGSAFILGYIYFVKLGGPRFMSLRKPFYLREPMIYYNFMMAILNLSLFLNLGRYGLFNKYNLFNTPANGADQVSALRMTQLNYIFYLSKFIQFSDTAFLILLKKGDDISTFHILQRTLTPFLHWFAMKNTPGQQNNLFSMINSLLYTLIYTYYGMKTMDSRNEVHSSKAQKDNVFEKIIQNVQTINFATTVAHGCLLYIRKTRAMHKYLAINFIPALLLFGFFIGIAIETYAKKIKRKELLLILNESSPNEEDKITEVTKKPNTSDDDTTPSTDYCDLSDLAVQKKLAIF